ncbi:MAG: malonyl-CoA decarboxylase family protein [Microthrixaceae bacterium]
MSSRRGRPGLQGVLDRIGVWNRSPRDPAEHPELSPKDLGRLDKVFARLTSEPELSARRRLAAELVTMWAEDLPDARANLVRALAERALPGPKQRRGLDALGGDTATGQTEQQRSLGLLRAALAAVRMPVDPLLDELSSPPGGVRFLIELRAAAAQLANDEPEDGNEGAAALDALVEARLRVLMTPALLELRRLDWDTPASLLQRVAALEAVHPIESIVQLRDRLDEDRGAYALFHPGMEDEPLAFVWLAFTQGVPDNLGQITDPEASKVPPEKADTAVFWSISATQRGLAGLGIGNELIKRTVTELRQARPSIQRFVTLSPIPSLASAVLDAIKPAGAQRQGAATANPTGDVLTLLGMGRPSEDVKRLLTDDVWLVSHEADELRTPLLRLAARHLTGVSDDGRSPDPVANFHLQNGAQLWRLNWAANRSTSGLAQSFGIMANYRYDPEALTRRARHYRDSGEIDLGDDVLRLLDEATG